MATQAAQNFASHRRWYPLHHFFVQPVLLANIVIVARHAWREPTRWNLWMVVLALALFGLSWAARSMALRVQDRVIRLEMRVRFAALLTGDALAATARLTRSQLVGLRFAGDAELPRLVERCLSGELQSADAVKKEVRDWQPDWLRA